MRHRLFIEECGLISPLGRGKSETAHRLFGPPRDWFSERDDLVPGRRVAVGAVDGPLPSPPATLSSQDSRNNRLMAAALEEIRPAIDAAVARLGRQRIAVVLGTSTSGMADGEEALSTFRKRGAWPAAFDYRRQEVGSLAGFVADLLGLTGPAYTIATACSSSAKVFASARRLIAAGLADAAIVGGADTLCRMTLNGFASLEALSKTRCNPFSRNRDGITIGEGAAAFLLSRQQGPVELLGIGETSDAFHATAPDPEGAGAGAAMAQALDDAGLVPEQIAYINLHGTGTPLNDAMESKAVASLFPSSTPCSSTKGMTGHMLGATGGVEAAFLWLALNPATSQGVLPAHLWDGQPDPALPALTLATCGTAIPPTGRRAMLSNSFGFGGNNVSLILGSA